MISLETQRQSALTAAYARNGYAVLHQLVSPELAAEWEAKYRSLPARRVRVGRESQSMWLEQKFADPAQALDGWAFADEFLSLAASISGLKEIDRRKTEVWINRYGPGEWVPSHCDSAGSTQMILCLQGLVDRSRGGELSIRDEIVPLRTGDAALLFAHGVPHGVTPIGSSEVGPSGFSRVSCAIRLYAAQPVEADSGGTIDNYP
jgi:hypothetical protein